MRHSLTKRLPLNRGPFVVVPFSHTPIDDSPFSPLPTLSSFLRGAQTSDPCRGFGSLGPPLTLSCFLPGLQTATPVEDSVPPIQRHCVVILARASSERPLSRLRLSPTDCPSLCLPSFPRRLHSVTPVLTRGETVRFPALWKRLPLGAAWRSVGIAAVVRAPRMCGLLTTLGGRAGYGKNRKLFGS